MMAIKEFLTEKKLISRGIILVSALVGAFFGAILMLFMAMLGVLS
jgi:hypothetical protein